jgi:hypothetical protein
VLVTAVMFYMFTPGTPPGLRLGGLMERVLFVETLAWYAAFGWRPSEPQPAPRAGRTVRAEIEPGGG